MDQAQQTKMYQITHNERKISKYINQVLPNEDEVS